KVAGTLRVPSAASHLQGSYGTRSVPATPKRPPGGGGRPSPVGLSCHSRRPPRRQHGTRTLSRPDGPGGGLSPSPPPASPTFRRSAEGPQRHAPPLPPPLPAPAGDPLRPAAGAARGRLLRRHGAVRRRVGAVRV